MTRKLLLSAALLALIGAGLLACAATLPLYTDPLAPARLSTEVSPDNLREWYEKLSAYETPKKRLWNAGQSLLALGLALAAATGMVRLFLRSPRLRNVESFFIAWNVLWLLRFPGSIYFYVLRNSWSDYPEGFTVPIQQEFTAWIAGALVSNVFLIAFVLNRRMPEKLAWIRPAGFLAKVRLVVLLVWILLLAGVVLDAMIVGDAGAIFSCVLASALLTLLACAPSGTGS